MTKHVQERMESRSITREDIESALDDIIQTRPGHDGAIVQLGRTAEGRHLEVAAFVKSNAEGFVTQVIKTAFWK